MGTSQEQYLTNLLPASRPNTLKMKVLAVALSLALFAGVAMSQDCCADSCGKTCKVIDILCLKVPIPMLNQCGQLNAMCTGVCTGMCQCASACLDKCATENAACTGPLCQATHANCIAMCEGKCAFNVLSATVQGIIGQVMALIPKAPAA